MTSSDLPLLDLFTRLREAGLSIGMDEYYLVLRALQVGFGIPDQAAIARLCRTIWVKSVEESRLFDYHFSEVMKEWNRIRKPPNPLKQQIPPNVTSIPSLPMPIPEPIRSTSPPLADSNWAINAEDEVQFAQWAIHGDRNYDEMLVKSYSLMDDYFPVTRRQMKQSWRYLRRPVREGPLVDLDIEATINKIERQGMLLEPVLVPRRTNRAELILLIDHEGSMVPFHILAHRLLETASRGGRLRSTDIYYFHNYPIQYLYHDAAHLKAETIQSVLDRFHHEQAGLLIFSDAGAARGGFNLERITRTRIFLGQLRQRLRYIVWLNPMPRFRWAGTTASVIKHSVPMFDVSRRGLDNAIGVLRGRSLHIES